MSEGKITFDKVRGHLKTINEHKWQVMKLLNRCGLYKQSLLHDLSKYTPEELEAGFKYYQGNRSANDGQKKAIGYSPAWLHHKGRNKHHWHYWLDFSFEGMFPIEIPYRYIVEMFCDRVAACKVYQKEKYSDASPWNYFAQREKIIVMTDHSKNELAYLLWYCKEHGLDQTIKEIRRKIRIAKKMGYF